ncbi:MAG: phosphotransferase [Candidatus Hydrothermia bacterium]
MGDFLSFSNKYFVNLDSFKRYRNSLAFYRPVSTGNMVKKNALFAAYPFFKILGSKIDKIAFFKLLGVEEIIQYEKKYGKINGVYLPPGSGKVVVQILNKHDEIIGYLKISLNEDGMRQMRNEAQILSFLKSQKVDHFSYPDILDMDERNGAGFLFLSTPEKLLMPFNLPLHELMQIASNIFSVETKREEVINSIYFKQIEKRVSSSSFTNMLSRQVAGIKRDLTGLEINTGFVHGDFKIWNVFQLVDGKYFIIDWELASRFGFPMWDLWTWFLIGKMAQGKKLNKKDVILLQEINRANRDITFVLQAPHGLEALTRLFFIDVVTKLEMHGHGDKNTRDAINYMLHLVLSTNEYFRL